MIYLTFAKTPTHKKMTDTTTHTDNPSLRDLETHLITERRRLLEDSFTNMDERRECISLIRQLRCSVDVLRSYSQLLTRF